MPKMEPNDADLRAQCIRGYEWPDPVRHHLDIHRRDVHFDGDALLNLASKKGESGHVMITFLSREYLQLGIAWAKCAMRAGVTRFAIAAVDTETVDALRNLGIPHVPVALSSAISGMRQYRNPGGFDGNGMAIIYSRLALVKFIVDHQIDVLMCDVDALVMMNPQPFLAVGIDIAFQRVVYFPKPLARVWGFTGCGGFVAYRASPRTSAFLQCAIGIQQEVSSDQIAFNLALHEDGVRWSLAPGGWEDDENRNREFVANAPNSIYGHTQELKITVEALPATTFWRHRFVPLDLQSAVVLHPNSPKSLGGKVAVFRGIMSREEVRFLGLD